MSNLLRGNLTPPPAQIQSLGGPRSQPTEASAADEEPYKYETLSKSTNIRLLKLCEGEGDIHCSLAEAAAKKAPHYRALSYTWGSPTRTSENHSQSQSSRFIYLNQKRHAVTYNLFDALHQLRDLGLRGYLWIDAICIDQGNIDERGEQVAIMGDIYANADGVIVWLGKADNNTREAFTLISAISLACAKADEESSLTPASFVFNDPRLYAHTDPVIQPLDLRQWRLIMEFFDRTWFTRVWVLQEAVLAGNIEVFCGPVTLNYSILADFATFMSISGWISHAIVYADPLPLHTYLRGPWSDWSSAGSASGRGIRFVTLATALETATEEAAEPLLERMYNAVTPFDKPYAFLEMALNHCRLLDATNPRDRVYAPLSLASQFPRHESDSINWMLPDYRQSIAKTFIDVSLLLLKNSPRLTLLSEVEDRRARKLAELPSWVPDFTVVRTSIKFSLHSQYKASACWDDIDDRGQSKPLLCGTYHRRHIIKTVITFYFVTIFCTAKIFGCTILFFLLSRKVLQDTGYKKLNARKVPINELQLKKPRSTNTVTNTHSNFWVSTGYRF